MPPVPVPDSYWVVDDLLLAGEYHGEIDPDETRRKLRAFLDAGVRLFVDLTEEGELLSYHSSLMEEALSMDVKVTHVRVPVRDLGIPTIQQVHDVLARIAEALSAREAVYVHCWGGIGRTGTIVGCWLRGAGHTADEALARIERLRHGIPDGGRRSPETSEQRRFVTDWAVDEHPNPR